MTRILFVCLGNICRSPSAEGVFRSLCEREGVADRLRIDSAGTGAWHAGRPPDRRAQAAARQRGIDLSLQRARQVTLQDFTHFHYLLAMDKENLRVLQDICPPGQQSKIRLFLQFADDNDICEVPDPYYGGDEGFDQVLDLVESASLGLLHHLRRSGAL